MTNIANMSATLTLSAWEFNNGLKQSEAAALEFANNVDKHGKKAAAAMSGSNSGFSGSGGARMVQQAGFALQDFTSQLDTRGFAGAMAAVSNNIQVMGSSFGPTGMAITAVGGALAGILLPKLVELTGWFKDGKKEAEAYTKSLEDMRDKAEKSFNLERNALKGGEKSHTQGLEDEKAKLDFINKQNAALNQQYNAAVSAVTNAKSSQSDFNRNANWMESITGSGIDIAGAEGKLKAITELKKKADQEAYDQSLKVQQLESLTPKVKNAEFDREEKERVKKRAETERQERIKGFEEIEKMKNSMEEKYGTERQKLEAKRANERLELYRKTGGVNGVFGQDEALKQFDAGTAAEMAKVGVSEAQKKLAEMGKAAGGSAGVDRASKEGIQAINRALTGNTEQSVAQQQLRIQEQQLKQLEQIARNEPKAIDDGRVPGGAGPMKPWKEQIADASYEKGRAEYEAQTAKDIAKENREMSREASMSKRAATKGKVDSMMANRGKGVGKPVSDTVKKLLANRGNTQSKPPSENVKKMLAAAEAKKNGQPLPTKEEVESLRVLKDMAESVKKTAEKTSVIVRIGA